MHHLQVRLTVNLFVNNASLTVINDGSWFPSSAVFGLRRVPGRNQWMRCYITNAQNGTILITLILLFGMEWGIRRGSEPGPLGRLLDPRTPRALQWKSRCAEKSTCSNLGLGSQSVHLSVNFLSLWELQTERQILVGGHRAFSATRRQPHPPAGGRQTTHGESRCPRPRHCTLAAGPTCCGAVGCLGGALLRGLAGLLAGFALLCSPWMATAVCRPCIHPHTMKFPNPGIHSNHSKSVGVDLPLLSGDGSLLDSLRGGIVQPAI